MQLNSYIYFYVKHFINLTQMKSNINSLLEKSYKLIYISKILYKILKIIFRYDRKKYT